jgi:hypothetical protein
VKLGFGEFVKRHATLLFACLLLLPLIAYPPCRDSALYLVIGRMIRHGAVPYKDAWDIKPPLIYALYAIPAGVSDDLLSAWYRLRIMDVLINILTALAAGRVAERILGRGAALPAVAWYVALYTLNGPGVLGQTEVWANCFVFWGLVVVVEGQPTSSPDHTSIVPRLKPRAQGLRPECPPAGTGGPADHVGAGSQNREVSGYEGAGGPLAGRTPALPVWARLLRFGFLGVLAGGAAALKPFSCLPLLAAMVALQLVRPIGGSAGQLVRRYGLPVGIFLVTFVLVNLPPWYWLWSHGGMLALRDLNEGFIKDYLAQGRAPFLKKLDFYGNAFSLQLYSFWPLLIWLFPGLMERRLMDWRRALWILCFGFAGFAAMWSQGRAINYHFQVLSPAAVLIGTAGTFGLASRFLEGKRFRYVVLCGTLPVLLYHLWHEGPRNLAAARWIAGAIEPAEYARAFSEPPGKPDAKTERGQCMAGVCEDAGETVRAAQFIRATTKPDERIIIWVNQSELYVWSNRLPANRFMHASGLVGTLAPQRWKSEYLQELSEFPPAYYVVAGGTGYTWLGAPPPGDPASLLKGWPGLHDLITRDFAAPLNFGHLELYHSKRVAR